MSICSLFGIWFLYFKLVKLLNMHFFGDSLILTSFCWLKEDCHSSEVTSRNDHQIKCSGASLMCLGFCWYCYPLVRINYLCVFKKNCLEELLCSTWLNTFTINRAKNNPAICILNSSPALPPQETGFYAKMHRIVETLLILLMCSFNFKLLFSQ